MNYLSLGFFFLGFCLPLHHSNPRDPGNNAGKDSGCTRIYSVERRPLGSEGKEDKVLALPWLCHMFIYVY